MFGHVVLGVLLGAGAARFIARRRFHHGGRGCGFGHGFHGFHGRGRRFFWIKDLGLSGEQVAALKEVWLSGRGAIARLRASGFQGLHALFEAATSEPLDRARLDEAARRHGDEGGEAARALADAVARAHEILTPEQRAKLRAQIGRGGGGGGGGGGWGGGDGPYRTFV
jgi:Spy/CpxP family protein refolding chaperone